MEKQTMVFEANIPSAEQFLQAYPHYSSTYHSDAGKMLFSTIMTVKSFVKAKHATELKLPAVTGVADACVWVATLTPQLKQYIGAVVCCLMEANNYKKGKDKAIPHPSFTKGKMYIEQDSLKRFMENRA